MKPPSNPDYDVIVLGGGSAGYAAATRTARAGLRTAVVEGGEEVGGLCILRGCMPTKALLYAADVLHLARRSSVWGLRPGAIEFDFAAVMRRKNRLIDEFASYRREQLLDGRFRLIRARARFVGPHTVQLDTGASLSAARFIISTGSVVSLPPVPGLQAAGCLTSDDALRIPQLPHSLIVLGGGAVAVEFAQLFARFDVEVTLIQRSPHLLREFDPDAAEVVERVFRREGIHLFTGTRLTGAGRTGGRRWVSFEHEGRSRRTEAEQILIALGRTPDTSELGLAAAGVETEAGRIVTDREQRTTAPHIYAAGDCTSAHQIVHLAVQQGEVAAHNVISPEQPRCLEGRLLSVVVFADPQVALVGATEKDLRSRNLPYQAAVYPFNDHGKSLIMEATDGFVKLVADPGSGEILGGSCVGPLGGELIHEVIVAMGKRMTVHEFAALPHYHPTLAEIWMYPAEELAERCRLEQPSKSLAVERERF